MSKRRVSVAMAVLNEEAYLPAALGALAAQTLDRNESEIVVVDGGSTDRTVDVANAAAVVDARVRVLGGKGVNCPAALNIGIRHSTGEYVAKVDGHGFVNPEFLETAVTFLDANPSAGCVGGLVIPIAETAAAQGNAIARFSRLGVGGGTYTAAPVIQEIDSVQCGVYRRAALVDVGGFDEELQFGEDEEVNFRLRKAGWKIFLHPSMRYSYHVRPTIRSLYFQYRNYGEARVKVLRRHPTFLKVRHTAPAVLMVTLVGSALSAPLHPWGALAAGMVWGSYAGALLAGSAALAARQGFKAPFRVVGSLLALHFGYGIGTFRGLYQTAAQRRVPAAREME